MYSRVYFEQKWLLSYWLLVPLRWQLDLHSIHAVEDSRSTIENLCRCFDHSKYLITLIFSPFNVAEEWYTCHAVMSYSRVRKCFDLCDHSVSSNCVGMVTLPHHTLPEDVCLCSHCDSSICRGEVPRSYSIDDKGGPLAKLWRANLALAVRFND